MLRSSSSRSWRIAIPVVAVTLVGAMALAEARPRGGGSRGDRTYAAPPATQTAPNAAQPLNRTQTTPPAGYQPGAATPARPQAAPNAAPNAQAARPATPPAAQPSFGRALLTGLAFGGLFALLAGGALGGMAGMLAMLLQLALIAGLIMLAVWFFRRRMQPTPAAAGAGAGPAAPMARSALGPMAGGAPAAADARPAGPQPTDDIGIQPADFDAFQSLLGEVLTAFGREDREALARLSTPEMARWFSDDLAENEKKGLVNRIANVTLLQGDLAEAWREANAEYATVAMRYSLADAVLNRDNGRVVSGSTSENDLVEATEIWTFRRAPFSPAGTGWTLSAIQDA